MSAREKEETGEERRGERDRARTTERQTNKRRDSKKETDREESYLYSAPQPLTKLMRIVHMRVSWYTDSKPWLTLCDSSDANSWLLKIFRLQPENGAQDSEQSNTRKARNTPGVIRPLLGKNTL